MTKQQVSGPMNTHSHHFAGPPPSRGANTRHVVSSACRCHESRDLAVIASASGTSSVPACAHVPPTLGRIYLPSFHEAMSGVAAMLDAADTGLRVMTDQKNEIEAEYAAWSAW